MTSTQIISNHVGADSLAGKILPGKILPGETLPGKPHQWLRRAAIQLLLLAGVSLWLLMLPALMTYGGLPSGENSCGRRGFRDPVTGRPVQLSAAPAGPADVDGCLLPPRGRAR
ncbi:hypothetical protein SAMN05216304_10828 [Bosea sp. OK403]|uniref:hypothetical protein n=1 Tax=Bosea sp. OK403 TaxID=1855286 RepID=UPI0008E60219|nr:hypothetical protein [Bosea sp. OK403]SFJ44215.1 hypothetical protein SAMN05216304_10828 [Bosea sp. OK403]